MGGRMELLLIGHVRLCRSPRSPNPRSDWIVGLDSAQGWGWFWTFRVVSHKFPLTHVDLKTRIRMTRKTIWLDMSLTVLKITPQTRKFAPFLSSSAPIGTYTNTILNNDFPTSPLADNCSVIFSIDRTNGPRRSLCPPYLNRPHPHIRHVSAKCLTKRPVYASKSNSSSMANPNSTCSVTASTVKR